MNIRLTLKLMSVPTLMGSMLTVGLLTEWATAADTRYVMTRTTSQAACEVSFDHKLELSTIRHHSRGIAIASASSETAILDFSAAESDAAAVLFGCDCPPCINALRQLRKQSSFNPSNGHCWTSLQRRVSPQRMQEVLQNLDRREADQVR